MSSVLIRQARIVSLGAMLVTMIAALGRHPLAVDALRSRRSSDVDG